MKQTNKLDTSHPKRVFRKQLEPLLEKLVGGLLINVPEKKLMKQVKKAALLLSEELAHFSKPIAKKESKPKPAKVVKKATNVINKKTTSTSKGKEKVAPVKIVSKKTK